tara:strand:- start:1199 stop:1519 length:321 start_codon:yes stop_codon:yes gene_type:complete
MKQQPYIRTNEEVGLPAFSQLGEGYAVLICHLNNLTKEKEWTPIHNSWGYPYAQLGHAIRKAHTYVNHGFGYNICIVNIANGEIMWASWELNDNHQLYVEQGDMAK